jgi:hypothetical protein
LRRRIRVASEIEVTTQRVTTVDSIPEAFAFIMEWLDAAGPEPRIEINPFTDMATGIASLVEGDEDAELFPTRFEVKIVHMVVEERKVEA